MADSVLISTDKVNFLPAFPPAIVGVKPGELKSSCRNVQIHGKPPALAGDEKDVQVKGCSYTAPPFVIPGNGTESIFQLAPNQASHNVRCNGKPLLLKGAQFSAQFKVDAKAKMPSAPPAPPPPDPVPSYFGSGLFINSNTSVRAS